MFNSFRNFNVDAIFIQNDVTCREKRVVYAIQIRNVNKRGCVFIFFLLVFYFGILFGFAQVFFFNFYF